MFIKKAGICPFCAFLNSEKQFHFHRLGNHKAASNQDMNKTIIILLASLALASCSPQRSLSRKYEGEGRDKIINDFGEPQSIQTLEGGLQLFEYVKETVVRDTPIGTGKNTLDPIISPGFVRVEVRQFLIDGKGLIVKVNYEKLYR